MMSDQIDKKQVPTSCTKNLIYYRPTDKNPFRKNDTAAV